MSLQLLDGLVPDIGPPIKEKGVLDHASSDGSRGRAGARDLEQSLHCDGDNIGIGEFAHGPVDVFGDDKPDFAPREGEVDARGTDGCNVVLFEVLRDKVLCPSLSHCYGASELDPDVIDVVIRPRVESDSDTLVVDGGSLVGTQVETLLDDELVVRNVRRLAFGVDMDGDFVRHGGGNRGDRGLCQSRSKQGDRRHRTRAPVTFQI